jgi:MGT family glycosyltransferase
MSRFLFVVPPLTGHVNPTIAVGRELAARGHQVAWCGEPAFLAERLPDGALVLPSPEGLPDDITEAIAERSVGLRGAAALKFLWEDVLHPLAVAMVPGVEAAVDAFAPDVLVADQQAFAGALVARRRGLPWATSATTSAELARPLDGLPKLAEWVRSTLVDLQLESGVAQAEAEQGDLRFSDRLVLAFTSPEMVGRDEVFPEAYAFVGPSIADRPERGDFPWDRLDADRPTVLVSLGTVNQAAGERFYAAAADALVSLGVQGVLVAPPELVPDVGGPDDLIVQPWVPQLALLEEVDAVVTHAGHNTTCEALAHGLPLVVAPIRDDQPVVADQVVAAGAGVRVRFGRVKPADLAAAVQAVLDQPAYAAAAGRLRDSFTAAGGPPVAADRLEALVVGVPA